MSRTLFKFGKQEETLKDSLCAQAIKHSAFHATSLSTLRAGKISQAQYGRLQNPWATVKAP
jgi:hypothetical protein